MLNSSKGFAILIAFLLLVCITAAQTLDFKPEDLLALEKVKAAAAPERVIPIKKVPAPIVYGIKTDSLEIVEGEVERGEVLSQILAQYNIDPTTAYNLAQKSKDIFNVRRIASGRNYTILHKRDSAQTAEFFIYEPSQVEYVIFDLRDSLNVVLHKREVQVLERVLAGEIKSSLFESIVDAGGSPQLVNKFADIYAWRLDLNRIQPGDQFKLIYEEKVVNGETIGFGELKSAFFEHEGEPIYAIGFDTGEGMDYFDEKGQSLKRAFLKEPLEYSRVSSRFSKRRFHPVQKRYKAHLGTDFAAPRGTPIRTVGNGVVVDAHYTRGNGYFVKVQHNKTYTTQYLHMSKFAKGIRKGARVKMGQTIGYVGSTGLATGPHLCYRFWKNGRQVDALSVKLPAADPVSKKHMDAFAVIKDETVRRMQAIDLKNAKQDLLAKGKEKKPAGA
ncbi:peptidoglycan DD-metalloendopeptidase family protein [Pontibacter akesuensis]|uniref:Murein DD-endopeptidase MepM and murein hydrolase activator NlpD, contain LysM domain n=1 Tax=Pontibacter akesuensis TaxID=388950 RepID=A0A1I7H2W1_9BACT|nr:peptidoglycan DD-metalloendopeptidase family protein [Pontibacter akesuensis]GHA53845.1 peptidase M23 [Pontibacter akesuensis]SFU54836.1 Murein DD-endopeptidase MepM and murein hydrolase activator NlpD, contain LysM domain [Pontibacter akesuensis]